MKGRKLKRSDERGALEGLPLYLIILVVIAGVGTAIIAGWMMSSQSTELESIEYDLGTKIDGDQLDLSEDWGQTTMTVTAYDDNGDTLEGVTVSIEGCGAGDIDQPVAQTDEDGEADFTLHREDLNVPDGESYGQITITAEYTGETTRTETETILVTD
ncbi:MAG: hypothetical protein ACOC55_04780 [Candidatus Natronoplasma sp.]